MKPIPDEKQLEKMLEQIAPDQTRRLDLRLSNAPWKNHVVTRHRMINIIIFTILAVALFVAITPQGRAFAQRAIRLFL